ncbi:MEDS domain-containing protein [Candidatus Parcubacteria bacterium]|nr:MEDS domain-containing protein [Candidatus Parcubacteria bacterium]
MSKKTQSQNSQVPPAKLQHFVGFYPNKNFLIESLASYVGEGLETNEICIVIATQEHTEMLISSLEKTELLKNNHFIALDAEATLANFMVGGLPDKELFYEKLGSQIEKLTRSGKPIRAYGEMVALLWKQGNKEAVTQLEELWNELAEKCSFSLYCAYPALHFIMDPGPKRAIIKQHNSFFSSPALSPAEAFAANM